MLVPNFWKLSHGAEYFTFGDMIASINNGKVFMHKDTAALAKSPKAQATLFVESPIGDYFYLTHGNISVYLLGQFSGPANFFSEFKDGWIERPFRLIRSAKDGCRYDDDKKWWAPNFNSTFAAVPKSEYSIFEEKILTPFFDIRLSDYGL